MQSFLIIKKILIEKKYTSVLSYFFKKTTREYVMQIDPALRHQHPKLCLSPLPSRGGAEVVTEATGTEEIEKQTKEVAKRTEEILSKM